MSKETEVKDVTAEAAPVEVIEAVPADLAELEDVNGGTDVTITIGATIKF
jgi:hypothetical protein